MKLYPNKLKLLHVARKQLGLDEEEWRDLLEGVAGCRTSTELDLEGFAAVMRCLERLGFESTWAAGLYGHRPGMATPDQVQLIQRLWADYSTAGDSTGLDHWLEHSFGVSNLRFVDAETAGKAITALKSMVTRRQEAQKD